MSDAETEIKRMQEDMKNDFNNKHNIQYYRDLLKLIKFPKIKVPAIRISKPPRWLVLTIAILIEFILLFFILWLIDDRTVFSNDYYETRYGGKTLVWGWFHIGMIISSIVIEIIWFFVILMGEFMAYKESDRIFYKLYR